MPYLARVLAVLGGIITVALSTVLLILALGFGFLALPIGLVVLFTWVTFAFLNYRYCRQDEVIHLLATATEQGIPLPQALRAYLHERPRGNLRDFWVATLLFVIPGYYWFWYRNHSYDCKVEQLARQLELGLPLHFALLNTPGVASREVALAAMIGEATGRMNQCLRGAAHRRLGVLWLQAIPQFAYPFALLLIISAILGFLLAFIVPKLKRIFADFGVEFPKLTTQVIEAAELGLNYGLPALLLVALLGTALLGTSNLSWYIPGFGWIPRRAAQSRVLHLLSIMLQTGKPIPQSLELVANMPVGRLLQRKILRAQSDVERGQPFAESLCGAGLLPGTMTALVQAAERAGNLPWALGELALTLHDRLVRAIQRLIEAFFPIAVLAVAALVAFIVTGMYIPIVKLIEQLVEITG